MQDIDKLAAGRPGARIFQKMGTVQKNHDTHGDITDSFKLSESTGTVPAKVSAQSISDIILDDKNKKIENSFRWEFKMDADGKSGPFPGPDGTILSTDFRGNIYALDRDTGAQIWRFDAKDWVEQEPVVLDDGTILVANASEQCMAIDGKTGKKAWQFKMDGPISVPPLLASSGKVYVSTWNDVIYEVDPKSGEHKVFFSKKEHNEEKMSTFSPPLAEGPDGTIYIGGYDNTLHAVEPGTGKVKWAFEDVQEVRIPPSFGPDGTVYLSGANINLYAIDSATGKEKWRFETENPSLDNAPVIVCPDNTLFLRSGDKKIYALDATTGQKKWETKKTIDFNDSVVVRRGNLMIVSETDKGGCQVVSAYDATNGVKWWSKETRGYASLCPEVAADGTIFLSSRNNEVSAFNMLNGNKKLSFETKEIIYNPPLLTPEGMLYVQDHGGTIYGLKVYDDKTISKIVKERKADNSQGSGIIDEEAYVVIGGVRIAKNPSAGTHQP